MVQEKISGGSSHIKKASSTTNLEDDFFSVLGGSLFQKFTFVYSAIIICCGKSQADAFCFQQQPQQLENLRSMKGKVKKDDELD